MKPARNPWMKFYPADWRADAMLRLCCIAARGLWAEMMCIMHEAERYGSLLVNGRHIDKKQLAGLAGISERECTALLLELEGNGVFSRDDDGTIYSRRMRRDFEKAAKDRENGKLGGAPDLIGGSLPKSEREPRFSRKDNPTKVEAVWASSGGRCRSCGCQMQRDYPNEPDAYTIDHIVPLAEGGDNSTENLEALCRSCNRRKGITPRDEKTAGGDKAHKPEARSQKKDDDDAGVRPPLISESAHRLSDEITKIAGHDLEFVPPSWFGAPYRAQQWLNQGWPEELILVSVREQTAKKRDGPPSRIEYFEKGIASAIARQNQPLPVATITEIPRNDRNGSTAKSGLAAIDRIFDRIESGPRLSAPADENAVLSLPARPIP